jgi:deoxyribose-phosphate aldolase
MLKYIKYRKRKLNMNINDVAAYVDHTLLAVEATKEQIAELVKDAKAFGCFCVCVAPCFVSFAKEQAGDKVKVCTVIGFPAGFQTTETKVFETKQAIENGADEIDMVINIGMLKDKDYDGLLSEIKSVREASEGKILKVIIETCLLSEEEKIKMCEIVTAAKADYIKTSTGFSKAGAVPSDIELFKRHIGQNVKIKAAGGIRNISDAKEFLRLGAKRLGTSSVVSELKNSISQEKY